MLSEPLLHAVGTELVTLSSPKTLSRPPSLLFSRSAAASSPACAASPLRSGPESGTSSSSSFSPRSSSSSGTSSALLSRRHLLVARERERDVAAAAGRSFSERQRRLIHELNDVVNYLYHGMGPGESFESAGALFVLGSSLNRRMPAGASCQPRPAPARATPLRGINNYLGPDAFAGCWENGGARLIPVKDIVNDALERLEAQGSEQSLWDIGQQVLPKQTNEYVHPYASLILFLEAVLCGCCSTRCFSRPSIIREKIVYVNKTPVKMRAARATAAEPQRRASATASAPAAALVGGGLMIQTLFPSKPSSSLEFVGHSYRVRLSKTRLHIVVALSVLFGLFACASVAAHALWPGTADFSHLLLAQGVAALGQMLATVVNESHPWLAASLLGAYVIFLSLSILLMDALGSASTTLRYYNVTDKDLPVMLPLVLRPRVPFAMVSYTWGNEGEAVFPRSLAAALPMCWVDVQMLSFGSSLPKVTSHVAATCHLLIVCLSSKYISSRNCILELVAAILRRRPSDQHFFVLDMGDAPEPLVRWLESRAGARIFRDREVMEEEARSLRQLQPIGRVGAQQQQPASGAAAQTGHAAAAPWPSPCCGTAHALGVQELLCRASSQVYRSSNDVEKAQIVSWYRRFSDPVIQPQRGIRITPSVALKQPLLGGGGCCGWSSVFKPRGALYAGSRYLTADGARLAHRCCCTRQQFALGRFFAFLIISDALFWVAWPFAVSFYGFSQDQYDIVFVGNILANGVAVLVAAAVAAISADLNINRGISSVLLPLTIASFFGSSGNNESATAKATATDDVDRRSATVHVISTNDAASASPSAGADSAADANPQQQQQQLQQHGSAHFCIKFIVTPASQDDSADVRSFVDGTLPHLTTLLKENIDIDVRRHNVESLICSSPYAPREDADCIATAARNAASRVDSLDILVFVIRSKAAAEQWLEFFDAVSPSHTILVVDRDAWGHASYQGDDRIKRCLSDYLFLSLQSIPQHEHLNRLVDSLGSKVGAAMRIEPFPEETAQEAR